MNTESGKKGSIYFTLFGVPTEIQLFSWLFLGIIGLSVFSNTSSPMQGALFFIVAGMLCLLAHEYGHAFVGRYFTKVTPTVTIGGLGGVTHHPLRMPGRWSHFLMVLAGPLSGYLLGLLMALILGLQIGDVGFAATMYLCAPLKSLGVLLYLAELGYLSPQLAMFYGVFFLICFCWTIFNLLPILPMDGGMLLLTVTNRRKLTAGIGMLCSALCACWFILSSNIFMAMMMGYFCWINWQFLSYRENRL